MKSSIKLLALSALLYSTSSMAQSTSTIDMDKAKGFLNKLKPDRVSHFSIFSGPSLQLESKPYDENGVADEGGISSWHQISLGWNLTKDTRFVINPRFTIDYNNPDFADDETAGVKPQFDNPVVGLTSTWIKAGKFSWSGGINNVFWLFDEGDREDGLIFNPGGFQVLNYQLNTKHSVGTWLWARYRYFKNNDERDKFPIYVAPYYSYTFNDKLSTTAYYEYNGEMPTVSKVNWDTNDAFNLLFAYQVTKNLSIQPIITLYRESDFSLAKGNLNFWVSGRFF